MINKKKLFEKFTDEEWIFHLMQEPANEEAHEYFFKVKCADLLKYIACRIYKSDNYLEFIGELYVFLSQDNWLILRNFKSKNNSTLYSYLSRCVINYFIAKKKKETKNIDIYSVADPEVIKTLETLACEDTGESISYVTVAFNNLKQRDKDVIRLLVIEGKSSLEAADQIWQYVNKDEDWRCMPKLFVQNKIAMIKHRALANLIAQIDYLKK